MSFIFKHLVSGFFFGRGALTFIPPKYRFKFSKYKFLKYDTLPERLKNILKENKLEGIPWIDFALPHAIPNRFNPTVLGSVAFFKRYPDLFAHQLKHEISHIKNNEFTLFFLAGFACFSTEIYLQRSFLPTLFTSLVVGAVSRMILTRFAESRADNFAISTSTPEELKGALRGFMAVPTLPINPHGTPESRKAKVVVELKRRGLKYDLKKEASDPRIQQLYRVLCQGKRIKI